MMVWDGERMENEAPIAACISEIARDLGLTRQTVQRWLTRWEKSGNLEDRPRKPFILVPRPGSSPEKIVTCADSEEKMEKLQKSRTTCRG
ncbi:hypothetical protein Pmani_003042 [Petrolisthes manimaculis]|uniref:Uncharacterized protein n=1 Tax=Petrolisthes manimaculis TaxID=1843537 RepID=A0AAE1QHI9_9EUCA|nr:hypothetical protein Pmani_003042 [Petrolisthes manimaculis]